MLSRLGALAERSVALGAPWTNVFGVARTLTALSTLSTLLFSHTDSLFLPLEGRVMPACKGLAGAGLFCLVPSGELELGRAIAIAILLAVASGYLPRFTAPLHCFCTLSFLHNASMLDGGDQLASNIALLMLPAGLLDPRRWHWQAPSLALSSERVLVARASLFMVRLQMAAVYFQASVAKLGVREWADGTALYYWLRDPSFGAPAWLAPLTNAVVRHGVTLALLTWSVLALELALAAAIVMPRERAARLLPPGIALHVGIAAVHGLLSFSLVMFAGLILYLRPLSRPFRPSHHALRHLLARVRGPRQVAAV